MLQETRDQKKNSELGKLEEVLGKRWPLPGKMSEIWTSRNFNKHLLSAYSESSFVVEPYI